jgi:hypothetical protein
MVAAKSQAKKDAPKKTAAKKVRIVSGALARLYRCLRRSTADSPDAFSACLQISTNASARRAFHQSPHRFCATRNTTTVSDMLFCTECAVLRCSRALLPMFEAPRCQPARRDLRASEICSSPLCTPRFQIITATYLRQPKHYHGV